MTGWRGRRIVCRALPIAGAAALTLPAAAPAQPLSGELFAQRLADPVAALAPLPQGVRVVMPSSHDRTGGNIDGGAAGGWLTRLGMPSTMIRREPGGHVLMEYRQPGCLLRLFMGTLPEHAAGFGRLQLFFDGEPAPRFDQRAADLFAGRDDRYPAPLTLGSLVSSGGNVSMVPFCFSRSLKVRTTSAPPDGLGYWQANVLLAAPGTPVQTYDPGLDLRATAAAIARRGDPPAGPPDLRAEGELAAGDALHVPEIAGAGVVRHLRIAVRPFDSATLRDLSLQVTADGATTPQVDVPLAGLFGDSITARPIHSAAFGMDPAAGTGYLALPIPFRTGLSVTIAARRAAQVAVEGWRGPAVADAGVLHGEQHVERAPLGQDTRVLDAGGSGRVAAVVMDDLDGGPLTGYWGLQRFLEGDDRIHVDGARSPSHYGTGHEEIHNGGWYYVHGAYAGPFGGAGLLGRLPSGAGRQSQYRVYADDGARWSDGIAYGVEHGGGDEVRTTTSLMTLSYRGPSTLLGSDEVQIGDPGSEAAHDLTGTVQRTRLAAYFEGEHDGNSTSSTVLAGGSFYPAPPASRSREGVTEDGVRFAAPLRVTLAIDPANTGVVLRGLFDQGGPPFRLDVAVDGAPAATWVVPPTVRNPAKRWIEDDLDLPAAATAGRERIELTLTPTDGATANLYGLRALSRTAP